MADNKEVDRWSEEKVSTSPSVPSGNDAVWTDVSSLLRHACNDLGADDLISGENFNLFAAMSALEIMDPKMDSGIVSTYYSIEEAIENGAAPVPISFDRSIDIQRLLDIMDHILVCEATWHKGGSLAQTVFSCIYLLKPERTTSHALLHSFCRIIRSTCNVVVSVVSDGRTNEEEDIFTMAYGLPLKSEGDEKCLTMVHAVEETISRQLKACKAPLSRSRVLEDIDTLQNNLDLEEGLCKAVLCRLRFRKHFHHVLTCMRRTQGKGLELAKKHIVSCLAELESMRKSEEFLQHNCAGTFENGVDYKTTASGCQPIGFDSTLNSCSATPTPPRVIRLLSWKEAVDYFRKLLHDLEIICSYSWKPDFEGTLQFVVEFQKFQPDLVARAYLQLLLVQDGKLNGRELMFAVICKAALLPEGAKNHDIQKNETVAQLGQLSISLIRVLCTNIAWQRRKVGKILQDWRIIYVQLELAFRRECGEMTSKSIDQNLCLKIYKNILVWVEEQTYWAALRFLVLGFELELYSPSDYCMVYWYIYVVLIKLAEKTHLKMMLGYHSAGQRKGKKNRNIVKELTKDSQIPPAVLLLQCYIYLAEGLMMILASLRNQHEVFCCHGPFNSEHERFIQHFELLQKVGLPDHATYHSFREHTAHARLSIPSLHSCFKDAQRIAKELRGGGGEFAKDPDKVSELRRIEQVAEHNDVALSLLSRLGNLDRSLKISLEFIHHPHFPIVSLKRT